MSPTSSSTRSQQAAVAQLSLYEKIAILPNFLTAVLNAVSSLVSDVFRNKDNRAKTLYRAWEYAKVRAVTDGLSQRQLLLITPSTDDVYELICKRRKVKPDTIVLEDGTRAHWIGSSNAENIVINFHGGGYALPASEFMMDFMFRLHNLLVQDGKDVAVLFLSYDISPIAQYPRQLEQAVALLRHVVTVLQKSPSKIILTGDSAGANLALATLSHISHPHPSISPLSLNAKFRGLVLISPWVSFYLNTTSWTTNFRKDLLSKHTVKQWSESFMGSPYPHVVNSDNYNQAALAPSSWWQDYQVDEVLLVAGADEVLIDGIKEFAEKLKAALGEKLTIVITGGEAHDMPSLDLQFGFKEPGEQARLTRSWISARL